MGIVIYNGVSSLDLHTLVQHPPEYAFPEKDCESTHVPGRNGDIITDTGTWQNVDRTYDMAIDARQISYTEVATNLVQWLHSSSKYTKLEDSYEPDYYRMAIYKNSGSISNLFQKAGVLEVTFNCKPQRYLKSGNEPTRFVDNPTGTDLPNMSYYRNPTGFTAKPSIEVYGTGSGTIYVGNYMVTVNDILDGMVIDSEIQDVYYGSINCNQRVSFDEFPLLLPGDDSNLITFTGGITSIEITPRWWTL